MSTIIDQRIVEMKFDNKHFESNVTTTMSTLDKLKVKLGFKDATQGFSDISKAASKVDLSPVSKSADKVGVSISAMQVVATTALANITNSAVNAGKQMATALTITPVMTGFQEYETQINAVQTILANTTKEGTNINQVNQALDELNTYADKTIYNFTEMTRNIGTFTAAGVKLDTSVEAIKGIANLAAVSGSNAQQASTAMYQLSQALSSGRVTLMDWNSVVNAGMGGQVFQDALKDTARVMGIEIDQMIEDAGSFRETLSSQWLSSEVLTETLAKFTGDLSAADLALKGYNDEQIAQILEFGVTANDAATKVKTFTQLMDTMKEAIQSGWSQSFRTIIGDFEEAKELFTEISDTLGALIGESSDARNEVISGGLFTGWEKFLDQGVINEDAFVESIRVVSEEQGIALDDMIEQYGSLSKVVSNGGIDANVLRLALGDLTEETLKLSDQQIEQLGYTRDQILEMALFSQALNDGTISMSELDAELVKVSGRENLIQTLRNSFNALMSVLGPIEEAFYSIFEPITGEDLYEFTVALEAWSRGLILTDESAENLQRTFKGLFAAMDIIGGYIKGVFGIGWAFIGGLMGSANTDILSVTAALGDGLVSLRDWIFAHDLLATAAHKVGTVTRDAYNVISSQLKTIPLGDILGEASRHLQNLVAYISQLELTGGALAFLRKFGDYIGVVINYLVELSKSFDIVAFIQMLGVRIQTALTTIGNAITVLWGHLQAFGEFLSGNWAAILLTVFAGILLISIIKITNILGKLGNGLRAVFEGILSVTDLLNAAALKMQAEAFKSFAIGIAILAGSIVVLASMDQTAVRESAISLALVSAAVLTMFGAIAVIGKAGGAGKMTTVMVGVSASIMILAMALERLSELNNNLQSNGGSVLSLLGVLATLALGLVGIMALLNIMAPNITTGALQMLSLSASLSLLVFSLNVIANTDTQEIMAGLKNLVLIVGAISTLFLATKLAGKYVRDAGRALVSISVALLIMAGVVQIFANMNPSDLNVAIDNLSQLLIVFGVVTALSKFAGQYAAKAGVMFLTFSASLVILSGVIFLLGSIDSEVVKQGVAVVGALAAIFGGLVFITKWAGEGKKISSTLITLTVAITAMALLIGIMTFIDPDKLKPAVLGLSLVIGAFAILVASTRLAQKSVLTILSLTIAIGGIAAALYILSSQDTGTMIESAMALGLVISVMSANLLALSAMSGITAKVAGSVLVLTVVMAGLGTILVGMSMFNTENAITNAGGLTLLISALSLSVGILSGVNKVSGQALLAMSALTLITAGLGAILVGMSMMNVENSIQNAIGLSVVLLALAGAVKILSIGGAVPIPAVLTGIVGMSLIIVAIGGLLTLLGGLNAQFPAMATFIETGVPILEDIALGIGSAIGAFFSGIGAGLVAGLPVIGQHLSDFAINAGTFFNTMSEIDDDIITHIGATTEAINTLAEASSVESLNLPQLGDQLLSFGVKFKYFASSLTDVGLDNITAASDSLTAVASLASALYSNGQESGLITGENTLSTFGDELALFAPGIITFMEEISGLKREAVASAEIAAEIGKIITAFADTVPNTGGLWGDIVGNNDLGVFGANIARFAPDMVTFITTVAPYATQEWKEAVEIAAEMGGIITAFADTVPNTGGLWGDIVGNNDLGTFGKNIAAFAPDLVLFIQTVSPVATTEAVKAVSIAAEMGMLLTALADNLPEKDNVLESWFGGGEMNFEEFGDDLVALGEALEKFSSASSKVSKDVVDTAIGYIEDFVTINDSLSTLSETNTSYTGMSTSSSLTALAVLSDGLADLGKNLAKFGDNSENLDPTTMDKAVASLENIISAITGIQGIDSAQITAFASILSTLADDVIQTMVDAFDDSSVDVRAAIAGVLAELTNVVNNQRDSTLSVFNILAGDIIEKLVDGLDNKDDELEDAALEIVDTLVAGVKKNMSKFETAGANAAAGIVAGATGKEVEEAGWKLGESLEEGFTKQQLIRSPSKTMATRSSQSVQGVVSGVLDNLPSIEDVGNTIGGVLTDPLTLLPDTFTDLGGDMTTSLTDSIDLSIPEIQSQSELLGEAVVTGFSTGVEGLREALGIAMPDVKSQVENLGNAIVDGFNDEGVYVGNKAQFDIFSLLDGEFGTEFEFTQQTRDGLAEINKLIAQFVDYTKIPEDNQYLWNIDPDQTLANLTSYGAFDIDAFAAAIREATGMGMETEDIADTTKAYSDAIKSTPAPGVDEIAQNTDDTYNIVTEIEKHLANGGSGGDMNTVDGLDMGKFLQRGGGSTSVQQIPDALNTTFGKTSTTPDNTIPKKESAVPSVSYVQNNYSPKSLSQAEIYRQTSNQLATLKKGR